MPKQISKVAVLGSGVMGSRIACHFANAGIPVLLMDLANTTLSPEEEKKGIQANQPVVRNKRVNIALKTALKSKPSPVFTKNTARLIQTGNFEDDLEKVKDCDWIIEVVTENIKIKKQLYEQIEQYRSKGTLISTNTSGIPIHLLAEGRSEDFQKHFCGTHFFNPPRYLQLLEIIPTKHTSEEEIDFLLHFGDLFLGKTTVLCKDTPAFIANRIGVFAMMVAMGLMEKLDLNINEIDYLTGKLIGHPKSATFRTGDVVGIDTMVMVADHLLENCPEDESKDWFKVPEFVRKLVSENNLGAKTGKGFYKKEKTKDGSQILTLDISSHTYQPKEKAHFPETDAIRKEEDLSKRLCALYQTEGKAGDFFRLFHYRLFAYVSHRIPEIADELYRIDEAIKAGFGWEMGPFEIWDVLGVKDTLAQMKEKEIDAAAWVKELKDEEPHFYKNKNGLRLFYDQTSGDFKKLPNTESFIVLDRYQEDIVWKNNACTLTDIGDGIICLDWQTKMNTIGSEVIAGIHQAIKIGEKDFSGLILGNRGAHFSAGANVGLIFMMAVNQDWDELNMAVKQFQDTSMHIRYAKIPIMSAAKGLVLGGGCEFSLHTDSIQAAAETYMGLVETGLGIIPGGGGSKEFALRASDAYQKGEIELPILQNRFMTIALAKTTTSAEEAYPLGLFRKGIDQVSMNPRRVLTDAKRRLQNIIAEGYIPPIKRNDIKVLGRDGLGALLVGIDSMKAGQFVSEHDALVAQKLAFIMCGGDLSSMTTTNEQYLLDLEREAFLSLCGEKKTLERLQAFINTGKIVRN